MKQYKGAHLYVNLGPTQTKRRLKGRGLGVKKVQSAGRNQAIIIHTATGEHLWQLEQIFRDVMPPPIAPERMMADNEGIATPDHGIQ